MQSNDEGRRTFNLQMLSMYTTLGPMDELWGFYCCFFYGKNWLCLDGTVAYTAQNIQGNSGDFSTLCI